MALTKAPEELLDKDLTSALSITVDDNSDTLTLVSTDADASNGPVLRLYRNSSSPADNDFLGNVQFVGRNDNSQDVQYAEEEVYILDASDGTEDGLYNINVITGGTNLSYLQLKAGTGSVFNEDGNNIDFRVEGDSEANLLFVDASTDRIGIGTTTLGGGRRLTVAGGAIAVTGQNTSHSASSMVLGQDSTAISQIRFYGADTSTAGVLQFTGSSSDGSAGAERMRIDSSGDVIIGGTSSGANDAVSLSNTGYIQAIVNGDTVGYFNRRTSDGEIIRLQKDGSTVGSIQSRAGVVTTVVLNPASSNGAGLSGGTKAIVPADESAIIDNDISLGVSTHRFKDLYLSGGVFLGGTGSANELDDYEEGTWTPTLVAGTTNPTGGGAQNPQGSYTKVGDRVFVTYYVGRTWTNTPAGGIFVSGLPFTIQNTGANTQYHYVATYNVDFGGGMTMGVPSAGGTTVQLYSVGNNTSWTAINWTTHTNGTTIYLTGSFSYIV